MSRPEFLTRKGSNGVLMGLYVVLRVVFLLLTARIGLVVVSIFPFYIASIVALYWQVAGWRNLDWAQFNRGFLLETVLVGLRLSVTLLGQFILQITKLNLLALMGWTGTEGWALLAVLYHPYALWGLLWLIRYLWLRSEEGNEI